MSFVSVTILFLLISKPENTYMFKVPFIEWYVSV